MSNNLDDRPAQLVRTTDSRRARSAVAASVFGVAILAIGGTVALNAVTGSAPAPPATTQWVRLSLNPEQPIDAATLTEAVGLINQRIHGAGVNDVSVLTQDGAMVIVVPQADQAATADLAQADQIQFRPVIAEAPTAQPSGRETSPEWASTASQDQPTAQAAFTALNCSGAPAAAVQAAPADYLTTCYPAGAAKILLGPAVLSGRDIAVAQAAEAADGASSSTATGKSAPGWAVDLVFDQEGASALHSLTAQLAPSRGRYAVLVDGTVLSTTAVTAPVTNGQVKIADPLGQTQAASLADALTTGPLPVSFTVVSSQVFSSNTPPAS